MGTKQFCVDCMSELYEDEYIRCSMCEQLHNEALLRGELE